MNLDSGLSYISENCEGLEEFLWMRSMPRPMMPLQLLFPSGMTLPLPGFSTRTLPTPQVLFPEGFADNTSATTFQWGYKAIMAATMSTPVVRLVKGYTSKTGSALPERFCIYHQPPAWPARGVLLSPLASSLASSLVAYPSSCLTSFPPSSSTPWEVSYLWGPMHTMPAASGLPTHGLVLSMPATFGPLTQGSHLSLVLGYNLHTRGLTCPVSGLQLPVCLLIQRSGKLYTPTFFLDLTDK